MGNKICNSLHIIAVLALSVDSADAGKFFGLSNHQRMRAYNDIQSFARVYSDTNGNIRRRRMQQEIDCNANDAVAPLSHESIRICFILQAIRAGGESNSSPKAKASKSSPTKHTNKQSFERGTKLTGAGASKRNPSIFTEPNKSDSCKSWTVSALAGDMLNRQSETTDKDEDSPLFGRLWAKLSEKGTLIMKLPPEGANEQDIYVELLEEGRYNTTTPKLQEDELTANGKPIHIRQITNTDTIKMLTDSSSEPFIPLEGIYGIYDLPCSGPHAVLITETEDIYTSPLSTTQLSESTPLLEIRRIKSLEIVSLRTKTSNSNMSTQKFSDEQLVEEARQLRLLRNSFKEHDFYLTVPRGNSQSSAVVKDVTHPLQRMFLDWSCDIRSKQRHWWTPYVDTNAPDIRQHVVDPRFFWNEQPALTFLRSAVSSLIVTDSSATTPLEKLLEKIIPVTSAFVGVERNVPVPGSSSKFNEAYDQLLISRRSKYRTGTRFTRRGADDTGAVANYAETEQICFVTTNNATDQSERLLSEIYSHVQTRGSIPLHWSSPADVKAYRPRVFIGVDPTIQARGLRDHLLGELWWYASSIPMNAVTTANERVKLAMVNLIDKHGDQGRLGTTFHSVLSAILDVYEPNSTECTHNFDSNAKTLLHQKSVKHVWYDFHAECKGGRWEKLSELLDEMSPILNEQSYFCAIPTESKVGQWKLVSIQDGVVRTNCMDCLDRTNVVQSMFGRYMLYRMFHERPGLFASKHKTNARKRPLPLDCAVGFKQRPLCLPWDEGEFAHRHLWADNADAISRLYAGTPALKGDFTRTGVRTKRGALDDGVNSIQRYYLNNFIDADRQEGMDLLVGSAGFNEYPTEDDEMSRVFLLQELADEKRRGYEKSHVRIKSSNRNREAGTPQLTLAWLPGDLRHHMKLEALQSRSPLSSAASEEDLYNAKMSSDFLMEVSALASDADPSRDSIEVLQSIDSRVTTGRPWWAEDDSGQRTDGADNLLTSTRLAALLLLARAPIFTTAMLAAIIAYNRVN